MKFLFVLVLVTFAMLCRALKSPVTGRLARNTSLAPLSALATLERLENNLTPKVVLDKIPQVFVYDHCPFCVRVRLALGLKNIKHEVRYLANDDVATPTGLVGKKIAPIFAVEGKYDPTPESMDIIDLVDSDPAFGPTKFFKPFSGRTDLKDWQKTVAASNRILQRPRYMLTTLPEFSQFDGKNAFVTNHQLAPYEKADWKANLSDDERWQLYDDAYTKSLTMIDETNAALEKLDPLIYCEDYCTEGGLSYDDIDLWSRLRSMTLVKGVKFPTKLGKYMDNLSKLGDVPLYYSMAC